MKSKSDDTQSLDESGESESAGSGEKLKRKDYDKELKGTVLFLRAIHMMLTEKWEKITFDPYLPLAWLILAVLFYVWATRPRFTFRDAVLALNVVSLGLVLTSLVQVNSGVQKGSGQYVAAENAPVEKLTRPQNPPDVYYFILDSYGRADLLKQAYGYDNSGFLNALEERGFYGAECSQSNYVRTEISIGSSLNMMYLQDLDPAFHPDSTKRSRLWDSLKHSAVCYNLESLGYKTVNFATGFAWNQGRRPNWCACLWIGWRRAAVLSATRHQFTVSLELSCSGNPAALCQECSDRSVQNWTGRYDSCVPSCAAMT